MRCLITGGSGFIGTNLIQEMEMAGWSVLNVDIQSPKIPDHNGTWLDCDIMDKRELVRAFERFDPTHCVHLAARTDTEGTVLQDYEVNTLGTQNLLDASMAAPSLSRLVVTSSQFVHQADGPPLSDTDYAPHTMYGRSKAISETLTREAQLRSLWTIVRPTNIWGPWHPHSPGRTYRH